MAEYEEFRVNAKDRKPLIDFMLDSLKGSGCRIIHAPSPTTAPFRITFETPDGERIGIIAYAFLANNKATKNRPTDEHRFQIKYGSKQVVAGPAGSKPKQHQLWQDPYGLYTTLLVGINPDRGIFVSADPVLHSPTKFFISLEFKESEAKQIARNGWFAWERDRFNDGKPNDNMLMHILSPYPHNRSALTDCVKLLESGLPGRKAVVIYGFDYPQLPMDPAVEAFETLARCSVELGTRHVGHYVGLVHPVHIEGRVFGWEIRPLRPADSQR